jgi:polyferredoxin
MPNARKPRHWLVTVRRIVQLAFLAAFLTLIVATVLGTSVTATTWLAQVFLITDPLVLVGMTLAGAFSAVLLAALAVVALSLVFPRAYCGWVCPMGTMQDIADRVFFRMRTRGEHAAPHLRKIKYGLLVVLLVMSLFGLGVFGWFDPICIATRSVSVALYPMADRTAKAALVAAERADLPGAADAYDAARSSGLLIRDANFKEGGYGVGYRWGWGFAAIFMGILLAQAYQKRFWCRNLCPLGAMLGIIGAVSPWRPRVSDKCINCGACRKACKMGAFQADSAAKRHRGVVQECILCYACERAMCPVSAIHIGAAEPDVRPAPDVLPGRRAFLGAAATGAVLGPAMLLDAQSRSKDETNPMLRPPGSLRPDGDFMAACIRCGECMRVCPTNALHPSGLENGVAGLWTPTFVFNMGYCEYFCGLSREDVLAGRTADANLCGRVCPTGAIRRLTHPEKTLHKIGTAVFDQTRCLPWARGEECLTCEEQCPLPAKAISHRTEEVANVAWLHLPQPERHRYEELEAKAGRTPQEQAELDAMPPKMRRIPRPYVLRDRCIGCGTCENVCPLDGASGVRVERLQTREIRAEPS